MLKPIGLEKKSFDATKSTTFYFKISNSGQIVKNKLTIRINETNEIVYQQTITSYSESHQLPSNTLVNGTQYSYTFVAYNSNGEESPESSPILFVCCSTPTIAITNIPSNKTINSGTYTFLAYCNQAENLKFEWVYFYLYVFDKASSSFNLIKTVRTTNNSSLPITVYGMFSGLIDGQEYYISAKIDMLNGMSAQSPTYSFKVSYTKPVLFSAVYLEDKCDEGYIQVNSKLSLVDGIVSGDTDYVDNKTKLNLTTPNNYIKWNQGFSFDNKFIMSLWFNMGALELTNNRVKTKIFTLGDVKNGNYFLGEYQRGYIRQEDGSDILGDFVTVTGYINNEWKLTLMSNMIDIANNTSDLMLWFSFNQSWGELILSSSNQKENVLNWNDNNGNNVNYNQLTTIQYAEEDYSITTFRSQIGIIDKIFPIKEVSLFNGVYDNIDITTNIGKEYSTDKPIWDYCTVLNCDFDGNVSGGNLNILLSQLNGVKLKAKENDNDEWITLKSIDVESSDDLTFEYKDYRVPSGTNMNYAVVPILNGNIEGDYIERNIENVAWRKLFVSDSTKIMSLEVNVSYDSFISNSDISTLQPINSKYPFVIKNGNTDYDSGNISGDIILNRNTINRFETTQKLKEWNDFLKNGKPKVIKDWNGNIWIAMINSSIGRTYKQQSGNGVVNISFSFVEQGKWDSQEDLEKFGLI